MSSSVSMVDSQERCSPPGITRSKSFTGLLGGTHKRSASLASNLTLSTSGGGGNRGDSLPRAPCTPVLGQSHRGSSGSLRSLGMTLAKVAKNPRPSRTAAIFEAITRGLSECISVTEDDISSLKGSVESLSVNSQQSQGKLYDLEKQLKAAERYLKRLEYHLTKLEELQDQYTLQQKLREGVRTMARAFVLSPGRERESALSNVRSGYKECVETLCFVEANLEHMMGTMQLQMKGVQGFARLCTGDSFEITIRHGHQKWKSRGRVLKNNQQNWDNQGVVFKALLGEVLHIKAVEMKGITKAVLLGNKYCDTKELFCANPQIMTVNLNSSGSLKLNIIITWNPLDGSTDESLRSKMIPKSSGSPACKKRTMPSHSHSHGSISSTTLSTGLIDVSFNGDGQYSPDLDTRSVCSSHSSASARSSTMSTPDTDFIHGVLDIHSRLSESTSTGGSGSGGNNHARPARPVSGCISTGGVVTTGVGRFPHKSTSLDSMNLHLSLGPAAVHSVNNGGIGYSSHGIMGNGLLSSSSSNGGRHGNQHRESDSSLVRECSTYSASGQPSMLPLLHKADSSECCSMDLGSSSQGSHFDGPSLQEVVQTLGSSLEDIQGQYPELHSLEQLVVELEKLVQGNGGSRRGSHSSDISLSVESALECFDFLNREMDEDDFDFSDDKIIGEDKHLDPELTAKTSDSGIASIARQLRGLNSSSPDSGPSPVPPTTGSEQLDLALCTHLQCCQRLLECIGTFGPLKHRETKSLEKLKAQTTIIERLLKLVGHLKKDSNASVSGHEELKDDVPLQQLWDHCADKGALCILAEHCFHRLVTLCHQRLQGKQNSVGNNLAEKVARLLVLRVVDSSRFDPDAIITVHQFSDYFWRNCLGGVDLHIEELADEVLLIEALQSTNSSVVLQALSSVHSNFPPAEPLRVITTLISNSSRLIQDAVTNCLQQICKDPDVYLKVMNILLEGLESDVALIRQGVSNAFACLKSTECINQLAYLCQTDESMTVRSAAKAALLSFGPEGRNAYDHTQLTSLGFQGLTIH